MLNRKYILTPLLLLILTGTTLAQGGQRPDLNESSPSLEMVPRNLRKWLPFDRPLPERIRNSATEVSELRQKREEADATPGWFRKSEWQLLTEDLDEARSVLKNLLASTPSKSTTGTESLLRRKGFGAVEASNAEVLELARGLENRRTILEALRGELDRLRQKASSDPRDLEGLIAYYAVYTEVARGLKEMCQDFARGADSSYGNTIRKLLTRCEKRIQSLRRTRKRQPASRQASFDVLIANTRQLKPALEKALVFLERQKAWAARRAQELELDEQLGAEALATTRLSRDVKVAVSALVADFKAIQEPLPPLVVFEFDSDELLRIQERVKD